MNILILDTETTISNKGHFADKTNKLVSVGVKYVSKDPQCFYVLDNDWKEEIQACVNNADLIIGHNLKFDLHWLRNYDVDFSTTKVWDTALAEFLFESQTNKYPSLNQALEKYGLPLKLDVIKEFYWERQCSCHVQIVENILNIMQKDSVLSAIADDMKSRTELEETLKNGRDIKEILKVEGLLLDGTLRRLVQILLSRINLGEVHIKEGTGYQTKSMIDSWIKQNVLYAERQRGYVSITAPQQVGLEIDLVEHVMQLWDILKSLNGWKQHSSICNNIPVDTDQIPTDILREYLERDLEATEEVFLKQKELFKVEHKGKYKLFQLQCEDLKVLQEMEYNGIKFNTEAALEESVKLAHKLEELERDIKQTINAPDDVPINLNSNDHLSAILYGGTISWTVKVADGVYKSGIKKGQIRFRNTEVSHEFPRLVEPDPKAETAKSKKAEGGATSWSVAEDVLKNLKAKGKAKIIIDKTLEYGIIEKLRGTYLEGYSNLIETMNWPKDMLHGNLNQCSVVTGRLSSTQPNLQNADPQTKKFMESRYDT